MLYNKQQVHFSVVDLDLHSSFTPGAGESIFDRDVAVAAKTQVRQGRGSVVVG
jgi:Zn-dependent oligopeptidase